jgi:hypothetical protein
MRKIGAVIFCICMRPHPVNLFSTSCSPNGTAGRRANKLNCNLSRSLQLGTRTKRCDKTNKQCVEFEAGTLGLALYTAKTILLYHYQLTPTKAAAESCPIVVMVSAVTKARNYAVCDAKNWRFDFLLLHATTPCEFIFYFMLAERNHRQESEQTEL